MRGGIARSHACAIAALSVQSLGDIGSRRSYCRGTGQFMPRHRFEYVMRNFLFTNHADKRAEHNRAWKVRSIIETFPRTFGSGFRISPPLTFDEAIIPSRSRVNPTYQYLKNKPHNWGQGAHDVPHEDLLQRSVPTCVCMSVSVLHVSLLCMLCTRTVAFESHGALPCVLARKHVILGSKDF